MMLILEITITISIFTIRIRKSPFLECQLVISLHALDHILDLHAISPDVLDSGSARLTGY